MNVARPKEAAWDNAKLYRVDFFDMRLPVSGTRLVWAVVGYKWVRICTPVQNKKFRMRRGEWDKMSTQLIKETDDERTDIQRTEAGLTNSRD
tara:strand:+ start:40 stop:315 length:276 start_codon:yes stop_codon:yes gene_type:complete